MRPLYTGWKATKIICPRRRWINKYKVFVAMVEEENENVRYIRLQNTLASHSK